MSHITGGWLLHAAAFQTVFPLSPMETCQALLTLRCNSTTELAANTKHIQQLYIIDFSKFTKITLLAMTQIQVPYQW